MEFKTAISHKSAFQAQCGIQKAIVALGRHTLQVLLPQFFADQSGSYLMMVALIMPIFIGAAGLGTEVGLWFYKHQTMQGAADSAAVSAAAAYYTQGDDANLMLQAEAITPAYGLVNGANGVTVTVNQPPQSGNHITTSGAVEVVLQQLQTRLFSALWNAQQITIIARAVAVATGGAAARSR